jgi:uncharacterized protein (DUF362 family)
MAVVQSADYFQNTLKAVESLGGMGQFLPQGGVVGILPNASFRNPGTYTSPEVVLAVIQMCYDASVKEICYLGREMRHLSRSPHLEELSEAMSLVTFPSRIPSELDIPQGKTLKRAEVLKAFQECKAFINLPALKHHEGTNFSCALKNMMGILSSDSCQFFHFGSGGGWYNDIDFLSQCIADLNLLKKPALIVADATECLSSNGPFGPGELIHPQTDPADLQPWAPEDEPRTAEGEMLFMLINGAAELYFEYGFNRAIFQSYIHGDDQWIDVEIYEMEDAVAAYGLQSLKRGRTGKSLDIGQEAFLEEYYLNFRKGKVQVSVVGQNSSEATLEALIRIANAVEARIPGIGETPELIRLLKESDFSPRYSVYIKGPIGLFNSLPIVLDTLAGFDEGVVVRYDDFMLALLKYPSTEEAASSFDQTAEALRQDFENPSTDEQGLSTVLNDGTNLSLKTVQEYIIRLFGENVQ